MTAIIFMVVDTLVSPSPGNWPNAGLSSGSSGVVTGGGEGVGVGLGDVGGGNGVGGG